MCGIRMPVGLALQWCGWEVSPYDWDRGQDLLQPRVAEEAREKGSQAEAVMIAMDCSTFSRARERPVPGNANAPKPLRDAQHPEGFRNLAPRDAARVKDANRLVDLCMDIVDMVVASGGSAVLENPLRAWFWRMPRVEALTARSDWQDMDYAACALGAARCKKQRLRTNVQELASVRSECKHSHAEGEWAPHKEGHGGWTYPTSQEQEYTAELAFHIALGLSAWLVRAKAYPMKIPKPPRLEETGDRIEWLQWPPQVMRAWAMPGMGVRLNLRPPESVRQDMPRLVSVQSLDRGAQWPQGAIYIGAGNLPWRKAAGPWATWFRAGPDGSPEVCVRKYAAWVASQSSDKQAAWAAELKGATLVCNCEQGKPCHGEVLVALVNAEATSQGGRRQHQAHWRRDHKEWADGKWKKAAAAALLWGRGAAAMEAPWKAVVPTVRWPRRSSRPRLGSFIPRRGWMDCHSRMSRTSSARSSSRATMPG